MAISQHQFVGHLAIFTSLSEAGIIRSICLWHVCLLQKSFNIFTIIFMSLSIFVLWSPGSYGDQTRLQILPDSTPNFIETNVGIVEAVIQNNGIGIVPVSNPYKGEVWDVWSTLEEYRQSLIIAGSHVLPLDHAVVQRREDVWRKIETIISHPQAYGQSKVALDDLYPGHTFVPSDSTIDAPRMIQRDSDAAICSATGLQDNPDLRKKYRIVQEDISPADNATKFVVIATRESVRQVSGLPPSEIDILRVMLKDKPMNLASKLTEIGKVGANIYEWDKAKSIPGVSPLYSLLLITSRLPREICAPAWLKQLGIEPINQKEELC